ncbi:MAG TPA: hypothetical protein VGI40_24820 [Pirellulaceae bacterium]|jgi:hypothetical protein
MNSTRRGYPLGALFVLVTFCAVLLAGISPLMKNLDQGMTSPGQLLGYLSAGALGGMLLGMILGLFQFRIGRGVITGGGVGCVIGLVAGALALLTNGQILTAATAMTASSGLIVAVAVMMRRSG